MQLPLLGLLEELLMPGETRTFAPPLVTPETLATLEKTAPKILVLVTVASSLELPSLLSSRWATRCELLSVSAEGLTVRGLDRVQVLSARGSASPYVAELVVAPRAPEDGAAWKPLVAGAQALLGSLAEGALPERPGHEADVARAVGDLVRALASADMLREHLHGDAAQGLEKLAKALAQRAPHREGAEKLEAALRKAAASHELPAALKQQLWAQVVELQKRLDIYDPAVGASDGDELSRLQRRLMQAGLPREARDLARSELRQLRSMTGSHHDYSTLLAHLHLMARLPWHEDPVAPPDLARVREVLDRDHSGLEKPKRRILEYLAVRALGGEARATVLCLDGPPGVGKTTIARSIAEALGRRFVRVALGGVHDESELRGHRMSFTAAQPGRIIAGVAEAGSRSAVMLLDELDKLGTDRSRDPTAALLEVLDPEQNTSFRDNFLATPYDLSGLLLLCTANDTSRLLPALRDRLEIVSLEGYTLGEKHAIARRNLLPRVATRTGLPAPVPLDDATLDTLIGQYTREAGVRQLTQVLEGLHRGRALELYAARTATPPGDETGPLTRAVTDEEVRRALGPPLGGASGKAPAALVPGVAQGLSVSGLGGSLLPLEVVVVRGQKKLVLTGQLGGVLRESVRTARAHLRSHAARYGLEPEQFEQGFHVHAPEAAVPKDGPSAGVALCVALVSAVTGRAAKASVAFTGEVTLTGQVLAVGGVRQKLLAASRAGVVTVVLPEENRGEIPEDCAVRVVCVSTVEEALREAFEPVAAVPKSAARARASRAGGR